MTTIDELIENNQFEDFLNEVEHITDGNAGKIKQHDPVWRLVALKKAHASDTCLNMVINIAMLFQDIEAARKLLLKYGKGAIIGKFEELGFTFNKDEDNNFDAIYFDPQKLLAINNDEQVPGQLSIKID